MFFGAYGESRKRALDKKRGEFFAIDFGEYCEQIGKSGVGDPRFFAVEDIVFAIRRKGGAGSAIQRVRSRRGFGQSVSADDLSRRKAR